MVSPQFPPASLRACILPLPSAVATSSTRFALRRDETFSVDPRTASLSMSMAHALSTVGGRQVAAEYDMGKLQDL